MSLVLGFHNVNSFLVFFHLNEADHLMITVI